MTTPFIGEIRMFGGNFNPRGWAFCQGQLLSIAQNTALFSILGTTYGGNGQTTFALPDLRGRAPIQQGTNPPGPGLQPYTLGQQGGVETVTLISTQMPAHNHTINVATEDADQKNPTGQVLAAPGAPAYAAPSNINANLAPQAVGVAGGSQPHENRPPYLAINFIIALEGIYPSRN
jgi:microcystin-dependent protein